jgi:hypothetical protein
MSIFQKGRGTLRKGPSEKHVVSIMLWFVFFVDFSWLHTFLSVLWVVGHRNRASSNCHPNVIQIWMTHFPTKLLYRGDTLTYTTLFTLYKSPEKKWHRSVKMDKNKCPFFKRVEEVCEKGPLKNTLWAYCFDLYFLLIFLDCIHFLGVLWVVWGRSLASSKMDDKWRTDFSRKLLRCFPQHLGYYYYTTLSLSIKPRKRNGIAL